MHCRRFLTTAVALCSLLALLRESPLLASEPQPPTPQTILASLKLPDDLSISLAAAEPLVIDPVAIRFDEHRALWVAEMRDYPFVEEGGNTPSSRISILRDTDGDGVFDVSTVFADNLRYVTGMQPWRGGAFVTVSGNVVYMKDTNGDFVCDEQEVWYTGFAEQNQQLRASHPRLAIDGWIDVASGLRGGKVTSPKFPEEPAVDLSGRDFRFHPRTGKFVAASGQSQFGLCYGPADERLLVSNRNPCRQVMIAEKYLAASPQISVVSVVHDVAPFGEASRVFPRSKAWTTSNLHAGQFTAACGVHCYRGNFLPESYRSGIFTCDPTGNFVHFEKLSGNSPALHSQSPYEDHEFLSSTNDWFRPVNLEVGPDGSLYVVDFCRAVIEHPEFMPDELRGRKDLRWGNSAGRIWRIEPKQVTSQQPRGQRIYRQIDTTPDSLVADLADDSREHRDLPHRLIYEQFLAGEMLPSIPLSAIAVGNHGQRSRHALWLLAIAGKLSQQDLHLAITARDPHTRVAAIQASETLPRPWNPESLIADPDPRVRYQALLSWRLFASQTPASLTKSEEELAAKIDLQILADDAADPWMVAAYRLAAGPRGSLLLAQRYLSRPGALWKSEHFAIDRALLVALASKTTADDQSLARALATKGATIVHGSTLSRATASQLEASMAILASLATAQNRAQPTLTGLVDQPLRSELSKLLEEVAANPEATMTARLLALEVAAALSEKDDWLVQLALADSSQALRLLAIDLLGKRKLEEEAKLVHWRALVDQLPQETPAIRRAVVAKIASDGTLATLVAAGLREKKLVASELDAGARQRLTKHPDEKLRVELEQLLVSAITQDRTTALADYQKALSLTGDARRGSVIFEKNCSNCHKVGTIGVNVAPDISDSRTKTTSQLLADIIQPNRAIDNNYVAYSLLTVDGTTATGILTSETATSITLRQPGDKTLVIQRDEIEQLLSTGVSLMPEGLEKQIPHASMADLLAYIKEWRYLDGSIPKE